MTDISGLLPHAGSARMIERVVSWDREHIIAATARHRAADNPLRKDGKLASVHLAEFGAQTMALHGGLLNRADGAAPKPALLVSVRDFACWREFVDDLPGELQVTARVLMATPANFQYAFEVHHGGERIASGRVAAMTYDLSGGRTEQ
jgi:predicted hotdog family 3-hydroxylacyl-ACP dehydratase